MYGRDVKYFDCAKFDAMDSKSLIKWSLLTFLTEINIFQPFDLKFGMRVLTCLKHLLAGVWGQNSFVNGRY